MVKCIILAIDGLERGKIEYLVISYDDKNKNARLSLRQEVILEALGKLERVQKEETAKRKAINPN